jgi:ectoine hydroxylase-related dioxygenase (phytanoyl-CoA dioxygenase family)
MLGAAEASEYETQGFIVLRGFFRERDFTSVEEALIRHAGGAPLAHGKRYEILYPGLASPRLARLTSDRRLLDAIGDALGATPVLSAFTGYIRTAGHVYREDYNLHCDAHMWRPVSSSAKWLFAVVPLTDFTESAGPLLLSAGSHRQSTFDPQPLGVGVLRRPPEAEIAVPVNVHLRRGDLLLMNGLTWHAAPGVNRSGRPRIALFNKYAAANAPPACGPFLIPTAHYERFEPAVRRLLPHHASAPPTRVRVLLLADEGVVMHRDPQSGAWRLPGGAAAPETAFRRWDSGANLIAAAEQHAAACTADELPWMTWAGDVAEDRIYVHAFHEPPHLRDGSAIVPHAKLEGEDARVLETFLETPAIRAGGITQRRWNMTRRDRESGRGR